ncbi:MAG: cupin domain-containing protein [Burkholderiales bacterium]|nr:cupin domain-containing protein [Burkholderiales bacterium]
MTDLDGLYRAFDALGMEGGWHRRRPALWAEPAQNFMPARWRYREVKPILEAAGALVSTEFAERRNLTMTNPAPGNIYPTLRTLVAAYQLVKAGETARSHRHTPNALRLILDGTGATTTVDGQRVPMRPGDVLLTPGGAWHSHANEGAGDCLWLDFLDVPLVHLLEPMFFEPHPEKFEPASIDAADSPLAFRREDTEARLAAAAPDATRMSERQVELTHVPGTPALRTIALHMQRLAPGVRTATHRSTANSLFAVLSGSGTTMVDGSALDWQRGDVIAVPAWRPYHHDLHRIDEPATVLRVSDEPVLRALGFLRERFE